MKPKTDNNHEDFTGGKHVTRARSWWKQGDVSACAAQTNMQCWVHRDMLINTEQVEISLRAAWEHEDSKDTGSGTKFLEGNRSGLDGLL